MLTAGEGPIGVDFEVEVKGFKVVVVTVPAMVQRRGGWVADNSSIEMPGVPFRQNKASRTFHSGLVNDRLLEPWPVQAKGVRVDTGKHRRT